MEERLLYFSTILFLGMFAQWLAWRLRLPSILLLLAFGFGLGLVVNTDDYFQEETLFALVSMSVGVILLEGGLTLHYRELKEAGRPIYRLVTWGALLSWGLTIIAARLTLGFSWQLCALLGAILVVTGPTVIGPLLRTVKPAQKIGSVLKWEGIVIDPIGAILAVLVYQALFSDKSGNTVEVIVSLAKVLAVGFALGYFVAKGVSVLLRKHWIPDFLQSVVILSIGLGVFAVSNWLEPESGLLTVTLLGIFLGNRKDVKVRHIIEFKENLRILLISCLFIILAGRIHLEDLAAVWAKSLLLFALLVIVVRPASVFISTYKTKLTTKEKLYLSLMAPRGIVAAAVSAVFGLELAKHHEGTEMPAEFLEFVPVIYTVIVATVAFYGLLAGPLARYLELASKRPQGLVFGGITPWAIEAAVLIQELGFRVLMIDSNYVRTSKARMRGIPTLNASILSETATEETDYSGIGRLLAITPNDNVNSMACIAFSHILGRSNVFQLKAGSTDDSPRHRVQTDLTARYLFQPALTFQELSRMETEEAAIKKIQITETYSLKHFREQYEPESLILFQIRTDKNLYVQVEELSPPSKGDILIAMVPRQKVEEAKQEKKSDDKPSPSLPGS